MKKIGKIEKELLQNIEKFCAENDMSVNQFGLETIKNNKLTVRLRAGKGIWSHNINKIYAFINSYRKK